jgi:hypothetical protein
VPVRGEEQEMNFVGGSKGDAEDAKEERSRGPSDEYGDHSPDESGEGSMDLMALKWSFAQQAVETPEQKKKEDEKKRLVKEKTRARLEASLTKVISLSFEAAHIFTLCAHSPACRQTHTRMQASVCQFL